jgi:hypothetical protein
MNTSSLKTARRGVCALTISLLPLAASACLDAPEGEAETGVGTEAVTAEELMAETELQPVGEGGESCNAPLARNWIGWPAGGDVRAQIAEAVAPVSDIRYVLPSMEPDGGNPDRLSILIDTDGSITGVQCG